MRSFVLYASVVMLAACSVCVVWAQDAEQTTPGVTISKGLAGLHEVQVVVEDLHPDGASRTGLSREQLTTTLTAAILGSRTVQVVDNIFLPDLYLNVHVMPLDMIRHTVYSVDLSLDQEVWVFRPDGQWLRVSSASTWNPPGYLGIARDNQVADRVKHRIRDMVDKFTVDYFKENPQSGAPEKETP